MNYGRFFVLDHDTSRLNQGITVFNYRVLKIHSGKFDEETPRYPIYLTITKESIDFRVHYSVEPEDNTNSSNENRKSRHLHSSILSLPLSANLEIKDGLTTVLTEGYETIFPVKARGEEDKLYELNYLYKLIAVKKDCVITSAKKSDEGISYSDLPVFDIYDNHGNFKFGYIKEKNGIEVKEVNRLIRKLILDFLFDLDHTKVFQNSRYYEHISIKLKENFFFNALSNKANFYYRELIGEREAPEKKVLRFYGSRLFEIESEWTKYIRHINSDNSFHSSEGWISESVIEMSKVFSERNPNEKEAYRLLTKQKKRKKTMKLIE